jgi:predicted membrane chloride channel (bestrophin family)
MPIKTPVKKTVKTAKKPVKRAVKKAPKESNLRLEKSNLENGKLAVAVEVKTTLRNEDIDDHLLRMEKIRHHATEKGDTRQFMEAMATIIASDSAKTYALKHGLFIIEPSGESVKVTKPTAPAVW